MERLRALGRGRRTLSVAAALLPLISLGLYFTVCGLPVPGVAGLFLVPPAQGLSPRAYRGRLGYHFLFRPFFLQ